MALLRSLALCLALLHSSIAFQAPPTQRASRSSVCQLFFYNEPKGTLVFLSFICFVPCLLQTVVKAFEQEVGAQPPLGFWDPLGLLENADQERFDRLREVELKHGRISMLAVLGHVVTTAGVRLPGNIDVDGDKFADIPTGLAALGAVPPFGLVQIFFFVGFLEVIVTKLRFFFCVRILNFCKLS